MRDDETIQADPVKIEKLRQKAEIQESDDFQLGEACSVIDPDCESCQ